MIETAGVGGHRSQGKYRPSRAAIAAALAGAFVLRLAFGVTSEFWGEDELQIYLIGLKFYTTGVWPLYGPDVVYTETQIPGGLLGLLVGGPFWIVAQPEAPYVLLNILSFASLGLLGWYITRRLPDVPRWFLWPTIFFSPWTLDLSTHVYNPSYVTIGSVPLFVAVLEVIPATRVGVMPRRVAYMSLGFGLFWVAQLHLSAALLVPIIAVAIALDVLDARLTALRASGWAVLGASLSGLTLIPTWMSQGGSSVAGQVGANIVFEPSHLFRSLEVAAQFMSLATFELPRFIGANTADRLAFLARYWWAAPFVVFAVISGIVQAGALLVGLFLNPDGDARWRAVRATTAGVLVLLILSFAVSVKAPASHAIYVVMPMVMIYAFHWWTPAHRVRAVRVLAVALLVSGAVAHVAIALRNFTDRSLYTNRAAIVRALDEKNYRLVGERRPFALEREHPQGR